MSSVLKALKKLEETRRGAPPTSTSTTRYWVSGGTSPRSQRPWVLLIMGLALGLLLAGILVWFGRSDVQEVALPAAPAPPGASSPPPPPAVATVSVAPATPVATSAAHEASPVPPAKAPLPAIPRPPAATLPSVPSAPAAVPPRNVVPATSPEVSVKQVRIDRLEIPAPGQQWVAPAQLTVSEILPPQGGERMAIVNGLPVMAGTMVENALVEEIHDDRILVSIDGRRVVVPLEKGR